jgi:hypothetical protein
MRRDAFWKWYDQHAAPRLGLREVSFRKAFEYLDMLDGPITIVETGCVREAENWAGDGQSTVLFDRYVGAAERGSIVHTVDLDPAATDACRKRVSDRVVVHTGDSVAVLPEIAGLLKKEKRRLDLLYLDSLDLDWNNPTRSAVHPLKELISIVAVVNPQTLVVVDDSALQCWAVMDANDGLNMLAPPTVTGKGLYVAQYAKQVDAQELFAHYQVGWTGMVR